MASLAHDPPPASSESGFTLVEILAVVMLTGFVMYAVYSVLVRTLQAREMVEETVAVYEVGPKVADLIARDLQSVTFGLLDEGKGLKGAIEPVSGIDASYVDLVTTRDSRTIKTSRNLPYRADICEIGYRLRPSEVHRDLLELYRREEWGVDDQPLTDGLYHKVFGRVKEFRLEYIEAGKETEENHPEEWDTSDKKKLPRAIRLRLTIVTGDPEKLAARGLTGEYTFERLIVLPGGDDATVPSGNPPAQPPR